MHRRRILATTLTGAAAGLAGCLGSVTGGNGNGGTDDETSSGSNPENGRTIRVSEAGEVTADPDLAIIQTGVEATDDDADAVRDDLAERGDALFDALVEHGIDEDDITTDRFDINTQVDYQQLEADGADPQSEEELEEYTYYRGVNRFRVEVHDVDDAGSVVDTAIDAGADTVGRIEFTLSDEKRVQLREEALEEALASAEVEAAFIAGEVDATVVEAKTVDTAGSDVRAVYEDAEMDDVADDDAVETELHPDDVTVTATVDVTYSIE